MTLIALLAFLEGAPDPGQWIGLVLLIVAYIFARWCARNRNR